MKTIRVQNPGGVDALEYIDADRPKAGAGEVLVRIEAIGVNFIDVYHRTGLYKLPIPFTPGSEAAGIVDEIGEGVTEFAKGDRVAYAMVRGAYTEYQSVPAAKLVHVPASIELRTAAARSEERRVGKECRSRWSPYH